MQVDPTQVNFSLVINAVLGLCGTTITVFGSMALQALTSKWKSQRTAQFVAALDDALEKSVQFGVTQSEDVIKEHGWDHVEVKSEVLGVALPYLVSKFPGALSNVGLSTDMADPVNKQTITDALQRALPDAFAKSAASPATPPVKPAAPPPEPNLLQVGGK